MSHEHNSPTALLARALDQAGAVVVGVRDDQVELPTPCRSWDVTDLVSHLLQDLEQFTVRARGGTPDWSAPRTRVGSDDWADAFRSGEKEVLAAWEAAGDLSGTTTYPVVGEVPNRFPLDQQVAELATHTWDLAVATGQSTHLDEEVGQASLDWARRALQPEHRGAESEGKAFGPEVPVPDDAPVYERLAGWFGHHR